MCLNAAIISDLVYLKFMDCHKIICLFLSTAQAIVTFLDAQYGI